MNTFSARLKSLLLEYNIDQGELSKMTGLTQATISRYLNGKMNPTGDKLTIIADVLNVSVDYLLGRTDNKEMNCGRINYNKNKIKNIFTHRSDISEINLDDQKLKELIRQVLQEEIKK